LTFIYGNWEPPIRTNIKKSSLFTCRA